MLRIHIPRPSQLSGIFDGDDRAASVNGVEANTSQGLPLSLNDRGVAASRIVMYDPERSDRAIAESAGRSTTTIRSSHTFNRYFLAVEREGRPGRDDADRSGRASGVYSRRDSRSSHCAVKRNRQRSGVSPGTARDVRRRIREGQDPLPPAACPDRSRKQPTEQGRRVLRWLEARSVGPEADCQKDVRGVRAWAPVGAGSQSSNRERDGAYVN